MPVYRGQHPYKAGTGAAVGFGPVKDSPYKQHLHAGHKPAFWYGDFHKTADAALFACHDVRFVDGAIQPGSVVEVLVARGQRANRQGLYNMLVDGELSGEVEELRKRAVTESVTGGGNV